MNMVNGTKGDPAMPVVMLWRETAPGGYYDPAAVDEPLVRQSDALAAIAAREARIVELEKPIDMVLYCPACLEQHIDRDEGQHVAPHGDATVWRNPPHKSHLCQHCGHQWRPADVPTNGVLRTKTRGKDDTVMFDGPAVELRRLRLQQGLNNLPKLEWDGGAP
jgi:hypothetical protein